MDLYNILSLARDSNFAVLERSDAGLPGVPGLECNTPVRVRSGGASSSEEWAVKSGAWKDFKP